MMPSQIAAAIVDHHFSFYRYFAIHGNARHQLEDGYEWTMAPSPSYFPNYLFNEQLSQVSWEALKAKLTSGKNTPILDLPSSKPGRPYRPIGFSIDSWNGQAWP